MEHTHKVWKIGDPVDNSICIECGQHVRIGPGDPQQGGDLCDTCHETFTEEEQRWLDEHIQVVLVGGWGRDVN